MGYPFQPFIRERTGEQAEKEAGRPGKTWEAVPELTDGFDPTLPPPPQGMIPMSFFTEKVDPGIYRIHIRFKAVKEIKRLYLFTGRKQLRRVLSLEKGEHFSGSYLQSVAEIIPRYQEDVRPVEHLFFTICTEDPSAIEMDACYGEHADRPAPEEGEPNASLAQENRSDRPASLSVPPRIFLCGDSTVTDHACEIVYHPGACYGGWGQALPAFLPEAAVENQAHCGLTTEDFLKQGHFSVVVHHIRPGDICLFQFGHNDQKLPHLWADRDYPANLRYLVTAIQEKGAHPVLVTPLGRNIWNSDGTYPDLLEEHAQAVQKVAGETGTPCIDLHGWSVRKIKEMGMGAARDYFHPGDYTHTNDYGACLFGAFMADSLISLFPEKLGGTGKVAPMIDLVPPRGLWEELQATSIQTGAFSDHGRETGDVKDISVGTDNALIDRVPGSKAPSTGTQEQFDAMERSSAGLLDMIARAKKGSRLIGQDRNL